MDIKALLQKAEASKPEREPRGKWAPIYRVYAKLLANGYTRSDALEWLVREGAVPSEDKERAFYAFKSMTVRRNKAKRLSSQLQ